MSSVPPGSKDQTTTKPRDKRRASTLRIALIGRVRDTNCESALDLGRFRDPQSKAVSEDR
jgi:hypothetical protein